METYGTVRVKFHVLTSVVYGGEWSASGCDRFTLSAHWTEGWVVTRSGLDAGVERIPVHALV